MSDDRRSLSRTELLVLAALAGGEGHGLGIRRRVEAATAGRVRIAVGTLYRTLGRLAAEGLAQRATPRGDEDPRRVPYRLSGRGRTAARREIAARDQEIAWARRQLDH